MAELKINEKAVLIAGEPATGKTRALKNLKCRVLYITAELKGFPFAINKCKNIKTVAIDNWADVPKYLAKLSEPSISSNYDLVILDSISSIFKLFRNQVIDVNKEKKNNFDLWQDYSNYVVAILNTYLQRINIPIFVIGHNEITPDPFNEGVPKNIQVKIDGGLKKVGIEQFFNFVLYTEKIDLKNPKVDLSTRTSAPLFEITEREAVNGIKYAFKTCATLPCERIRSPEDMFEINELYMDNDYQKLLDRLDSYYGYSTQLKE